MLKPVARRPAVPRSFAASVPWAHRCKERAGSDGESQGFTDNVDDTAEQEAKANDEQVADSGKAGSAETEGTSTEERESSPPAQDHERQPSAWSFLEWLAGDARGRGPAAERRPVDLRPGGSAAAEPGGGPGDASTLLHVPSTGEPVYLWEENSDEVIAEQVASILSDFGALAAECDRLFQQALTKSAQTIDAQQLYEITQQHIDRFGCRSPHVLERIGHVYTAAVSGNNGDGIRMREFRGYIAALLTQILRELEERSGTDPDNSHFGADDDGGGWH